MPKKLKPIDNKENFMEDCPIHGLCEFTFPDAYNTTFCRQCIEETQMEPYEIIYMPAVNVWAI